MKKLLMFLLSVMILSVTGCGSTNGELVATVVTDDNGKAVVSDLPLGKYRVVEVEAPYGYVLNKEEQVVTFVYVDDKTPVIKDMMMTHLSVWNILYHSLTSLQNLSFHRPGIISILGSGQDLV